MLTKVLTWTIVLISVLALTLAAGCGSNSDNANATQNSGQTAQATSVKVGSTKGDMAPDFTLKSLTGGDLTLSSLRGKAVIVDFWDTWCPPCRKALPHLQELSETYRADLVVVGVAFGREGEDKVRAYAKQHGLTFEMVLFNQSSSILTDFGGIQSIPTTFLIDADGVIQAKWVGAADKATYENAVVAVINHKS